MRLDFFNESVKNVRVHSKFLLSNYIFVGERVAEISRLFGVHAKGLIGGEIPCLDEEYPLTEHLECISCAFGKKRGLLAKAFGRLAAEAVILESAPDKTPNPAMLAEELSSQGIPCHLVDFSKGITTAILGMGTILGMEREAGKITRQYKAAHAKMAKHEKMGKKVVVILGINNPRMARGHFLLEVPGCAGGREVFSRLGLMNVGAPLMNDEPVCLDGVQLLANLDGLEKALPDVIVLTGNSRPGQLALAELAKSRPQLMGKIPALSRQHVLSLPHYCDALEARLPGILQTWADGLACLD